MVTTCKLGAKGERGVAPSAARGPEPRSLWIFLGESLLTNMSRNYFVYILASDSRELYVGVTNDLSRRLAEHRSGLMKGYAFEHGITRLVHFEVTQNVRSAIAREKQVKSWRRQKRIALIEHDNPDWRDLGE
jgi:putative endonuclease